ncbi:hypothetical protein C2S53_009036 [Perilla frutescens var. hirtella]|uniref:Replication factor A C-terminal domain-containing protein n=1 Tax=Perilla frutescens var. hirtella TaxID=608512 RepID=A0AAD4JRT9_PERFH|nr:hypothetical protein C2S53_009036 [Perilla frutescens var. hirtella]
MPPFFSLVERVRETGHSIYELILKLRVVRIYEQSPCGRSHAKPTLEMILHDRVGDRIHGTMRKSDLKRFNIDFVEGGLYPFQFFDIEDNRMKYRTTQHLFKFISSSYTKVIPIVDEDSGISALTVSTGSGSSINNIDDDLSSGNHSLIMVVALRFTKIFIIRLGWDLLDLGKIIEVITKGNWCYLACTRCSQKVSQMGGRDFCDKCNLKDITGSYRYKLLLKIDDETGITSLILWNKESVELIGKTAMELQALMVEKVLFKVQVRENDTNPEGPFNVIRVSVDNNVISKYCGMRVIHEENTVRVPDLHTILATVDFADEPKNSSERSAFTQQSTTMLTDSSSVKKNLNSQFSSMTNGKNKSPVIKIEKE